MTPDSPVIKKSNQKKSAIVNQIKLPKDSSNGVYFNTEVNVNEYSTDIVGFKDLLSARSTKSITTSLARINLERIEREKMRKRKISLTSFAIDQIRRRAISLPSQKERFKYARHRGVLLKQSKSLYETNSLIPLNRGSGFFLEANLKHRPYMEDYVKLFDNFHMTKMSTDKAFFVLCDGHAGEDVAKVVVERLPDIVYDYFKSVKYDQATEERHYIEELLINSFKRMDEELVHFEEVGSTCNTILIQYENKKRVLYSANVGDSRSVLIRKKEAIRLSYDHKAIDKAEIDRVRKEGGIFLKKRFYGSLAITRALGDYTFKNEGVGLSNIPYITRTELCKEDMYVIMASDGVWDVINEELSYALINENTNLLNNPTEIAKLFVQKSVQLGSKDNISCIAIRLN